jgi:hypothetical protein
VVAVGETTCEPLTATAAPFKVALVALVEDQVSVELPPGAIRPGFAVMVAVGALTVTATWPQSDWPAVLEHVMRYVVVVVGETTSDPFNATEVPFRFAVVQFFVVHVRVELPPGAIEVGFALIPAAGGPPLEPTVTVTWPQSDWPAALEHVMRYVVVVVGETTSDPFNATEVPFRFAVVQFFVVHVRVELPPDAIEVGFALIPAAGVWAWAGVHMNIIGARNHTAATSRLQNRSLSN